MDSKITTVNALPLQDYQHARLDLASKNVEAARERLHLRQGVGAAEDSVRRQEEIHQAATQFESLLLQQMLKSMWSTVPSEGVLGGSREEEYYRDMLTEGLADSIAEHQSIGVRDVIINDINRLDKKENPSG